MKQDWKPRSVRAHRSSRGRCNERSINLMIIRSVTGTELELQLAGVRPSGILFGRSIMVGLESVSNPSGVESQIT